MSAMILLEGLERLLKEKAIGASASYPSGWVKTDDLTQLAKDINDGKINQFGKRIEEKKS